MVYLYFSSNTLTGDQRYFRTSKRLLGPGGSSNRPGDAMKLSLGGVESKIIGFPSFPSSSSTIEQKGRRRRTRRRSCQKRQLALMRTCDLNVPPFHCSIPPFHSTVPFHHSIPPNSDTPEVRALYSPAGFVVVVTYTQTHAHTQTRLSTVILAHALRVKKCTCGKNRLRHEACAV